MVLTLLPNIYHYMTSVYRYMVSVYRYMAMFYRCMVSVYRCMVISLGQRRCNFSYQADLVIVTHA